MKTLHLLFHWYNGWKSADHALNNTVRQWTLILAWSVLRHQRLERGFSCLLGCISRLGRRQLFIARKWYVANSLLMSKRGEVQLTALRPLLTGYCEKMQHRCHQWVAGNTSELHITKLKILRYLRDCICLLRENVTDDIVSIARAHKKRMMRKKIKTYPLIGRFLRLPRISRSNTNTVNDLIFARS